jgi:hypothetical protein
MKDRITEYILAEDSQAYPGSPAFLHRYQAQCSKVIENLTSEERDHCEQLVMDWNKNGPESDVRAVYVPVFSDLITLD